MTKKTTASEHVEQVTFVAQFKKKYPGVRIFAIPNGGLRNKTVAQKLKLEGAASGVPDLYIPKYKVWVEMKKEVGGRVSEPQKDWASYLESVGDTVIIAHGWRHAMEAFTEWLSNHQNS